MTVLDGWKDFYVIVGSSAGALIGLQFVVIMLIAAKPITRVDARAGGAFATPSVVHFGVVLLLSAIGSAPWNGVITVAVLWGLVGLCGVVYVVVVARRMRVQSAYSLCSRIGCFMFCFHLRHTQFWLYRHTYLTPMRAQPCSSSAQQRCCCSSLAFTMPGTPSRITSLSDRSRRGSIRVDIPGSGLMGSGGLNVEDALSFRYDALCRGTFRGNRT